MQLAHQAQRKWQRAQPFDAVLQGDNVIADFAQVRRAALDRSAGLGGEQLAEGCLRALDAARKHCLAAYEGPDQEVGIRQAPPLAGEAPRRAVRRRELRRKPIAPRDGWRQGRRHVGTVAAGAANPAAVWLAVGGGHRAFPCLRPRKQPPRLLASEAENANSVGSAPDHPRTAPEGAGGRTQRLRLKCPVLPAPAHQAAASRTSILPVTAAEMRAVRNSLRRAMASRTLAMRASILAD